MNIYVADYSATHAVDAAARQQLNLQLGALSSTLEHAVPEQLFDTDPDTPPDAVSAVKALAKASAAGQRIYQITEDNLNQALPNLHLAQATEEEIVRAVRAGKWVITHTDPIAVPGWSGAGYVILDPETGVGAWKIGGGGNGGFLGVALGVLLGLCILTLFLGGPAVAIMATIASLAASFVVAHLSTILVIYPEGRDDVWRCFVLGVLIGLDLVFIWGPLAMKSVPRAVGMALLATLDSIGLSVVPGPTDVKRCVPGL